MNDDLFEYLLVLKLKLNQKLSELNQPKEQNWSEFAKSQEEITSLKAKISLINTLFSKFGDNR